MLLLTQQSTTELITSGKTTGLHKTNCYEILVSRHSTEHCMNISDAELPIISDLHREYGLTLMSSI
jgi:hypothetical protein